jgi:hypothetical protein
MNALSRFRRRSLPALVALVTLFLSPEARACATCMGDPSSNHAEAMNAAIFLMLGCIGGVLALLSAFGIYLYRRSRAPIPPHIVLAEMIGSHPK